MALATLVLPSTTASSASSATTTKASAASAGDRSNSRRIQQQQEKSQHHHGSKRTKKPPPPLSSQRPSSLPAAPRTPPGAAAGTRRATAAASTSSSSSNKKSPKMVATAASSSSNKKSSKVVVATASSYQQQHKKVTAASSSSSWEQLKSLLSCRTATAAARVHDPAAPSALARLRGVGGSLCAMRDVVVDAAAVSSVASTDRDTAPLTRRARAQRRAASSSSSTASIFHGNSSSLRSRGGLSGCYECRAINVEPMSRRYPRARELCACSQCGEVFTKPEGLQHHLAIRHAVSELGPEDSGRNIVEIIFKSSWRRQMTKRAAPAAGDHRPAPACRIERVLKVHNPARTVARFEAYRDAVRARRCRGAAAARAAADGNELLRFHSAPLACALGLDGGTSLCVNDNETSGAAACCGVCTAIRHGFAPWVGAHPLGVRTTASSGRAHDYCGGGSSSAAAPPLHDDDDAAGGCCRAMLVCRVIAGRVRRRHNGEAAATTAAAAFAPAEEEEESSGSPVFDSVASEEDASGSSVYGDLEELFVANPRAILPCFVVIYRVLE